MLGHLIQTPFYQRLRVELQLGYAVFSAVRQIDGQTGLLFGVQSPGASLAEILGHIETFLSTLPERLGEHWEAQRETLAAQLDPTSLPLTDAAELLWQAHLANHSSDHLNHLGSAIRSLTPGQLLAAIQQLQQAAGGWLCLANGPAPRYRMEARKMIITRPAMSFLQECNLSAESNLVTLAP